MAAFRFASWLIAPLAVLLCGCRVPARAGDPTIESRRVNGAIFRQPVVYLHIVSVNGAEVPARAVEATVRTIGRHLNRPIEVRRLEPVQLPTGYFGCLAEPLVFPVFENGRQIGAADLSGQPPVHRLAQPDRGILGVVGRTFNEGTENQPRTQLYPLVGPDAILVAVLPGPEGGGGVTGYATAVATGPAAFRTGLVVLHESAIEKRSGFFVSRNRLWEWTLTHEIGHVLGVPAMNTHIWRVPGLGPHCTRPECVMYTGVDWRVVVSGVLHGWPVDFCDLCESELRAARDAAPGDEPAR